MFTNHLYQIYMHKQNLALDTIRYAIKPNQTKPDSTEVQT